MALYESSQKVHVLGGLCKITRIRILEDKITHLTGDVTVVDHGTREDYQWTAQPGQQEHILSWKKYCFDVNPTKSFWGNNRFTLLERVDDAIRHQVMHALLYYKPALLK